MKVFLITLAVLFVAATVLPLFKYDAWWIRVFDFPRAQIAIAGVIIAAVYLYFWDVKSVSEGAVLAALAVCVVFQAYKMYPYSPIAGRQVEDVSAVREDARISLLVANVLMDNREAGRLLALIDEYEPDVVLTVETDGWWEEQLRVIEAAYPHTVKEPLPNTYGMLLHSRFELVGAEVKYLVEGDIPSIHTEVALPNRRHVRLFCVHPKPPYPKEDTHTTERDAELLLVGKAAHDLDAPVIVAGDLNDVAWSYTTTLFQKVSGLLDPRIGRGMYNSFHAENWLLRWPLDHVFHSRDFELVELQRLSAFGSDHFPILARLQLDPAGPLEQEQPRAEPEEEREANKKIDKADGSAGA